MVRADAIIPAQQPFAYLLKNTDGHAQGDRM